MLQFVLGRSGYGKTHYIRDILHALLQKEEGKILLVVPEQCSFHTEKWVLDAFGGSQALRVDITGFTRLAATILKDTGNYKGKRLSEVSRTVLMGHAIKNTADKLAVYKRSVNHPDFIREMLAMTAEFKSASVKSADLEALSLPAAALSLSGKIKDMALIFGEHERLLGEGFADPMDDLTQADIILDGKSGYFKGYTVIFDEFTGFTAQEYAIICQMLRQSADIYMTLCTNSAEETDGGMGLFSAVKETLAAVKEYAAQEGAEVREPVFLTEDYRHKNTPALQYIDKNIFMPAVSESGLDPEGLTLYQAHSLYDECEFTAWEIHRKLREGYRCRDFAVIVSQLEAYGGLLESAFERYGLSCYMDRRKSMEACPLTALLSAAMDCVTGSYQSRHVLRYIKTGLAGITPTEAALFENYVLTWRMNGKAFHSDFTGHVDGLHNKNTPKSDEKLTAINALRQKIIEPLVNLQKAVRRGNGDTIGRALYEFLVEIDAYTSLTAYAEVLTEQGEMNAGLEQMRSWDVMMTVLDEMAAGAGAEGIGLKRYQELFGLAMASFDLGALPQGLDQVLVGAAGRIRPGNPKHVFLLGLNEGLFPKTPGSSGLLTPADRAFLLSLGIKLKKGMKEQAVRENLSIYMAMTSSSESLYISWPAVGIDGQKLSKSIVIAQCEQMFPNMPVYTKACLEDLESETAAFEYLSCHFQENNEKTASLKAYFETKDAWRDSLARLQDIAAQKPFVFAETQGAKSLFGEDMRLSATQIESFHQCRFSYFCQYGLRLTERGVSHIDSTGFGRVVHYILEKCLPQMAGTGFENVNSGQIEAMSRSAIESYAGEFMGGLEGKSTAFLYKLGRIGHSACELLERIRLEFLQSRFVPIAYELSIGDSTASVPAETQRLPEGGSFYLVGKTDRVDQMVDGNKTYIRVVDYKSYGKDFQLYELLYGINTQMLVYLSTLMKHWPGALPAGVLYLTAVSPAAKNAREDDDASVEKSRLKAMSMKGLVLDDPVVIEAMEAPDNKGYFLELKSKGDNVIPLKALEGLMKKLETQMGDMVKTLRKGDIAACPTYDKEAYMPCERCSCRAVCGYEEGDPVLKMTPYSKRSVLEILAGEGEAGEGHE